MFEASSLQEAKDQVDNYQCFFASASKGGPLQVYIRHEKNAGPLERELYRRAIKTVVDALRRYGIEEDLVKGKVIFDARKSPVDGSIGEHDPENDTPVIFDRNKDGLLSVSKMAWTLAHEIGHRVYQRMTEGQRKIFSGALEFVGKKLSDDVLKLMRDQAKTKKKILDDLHYRLFDALWWAFKLTGSKDPNEFYDWIKEKKVTTELPTEYAQVNDSEAWAETFADLVLDRKKTRKNRRTGRFLRRIVRGIIDLGKDGKKFTASELV